MSTEFKDQKKKWLPMVERLVLFVAGVATIIGVIITLQNNREQKTYLPEYKSQVQGQKEKTTKSERDVKPELLIREKKSTLFSKDIAVLIVENENRIDWTFSTTIELLLKKQGVKITKPSLFTNSFLTGGGFTRLFAGSSHKTEIVQLPQHFKTGVFGKKTVVFEKNNDFTDLITATMTLELHEISSLTGTVQQSVSFTQKGAGFSNADASKIAEEKITQEIETQLSKIFNHLEN
jgi:hypothetical protein